MTIPATVPNVFLSTAVFLRNLKKVVLNFYQLSSLRVAAFNFNHKVVTNRVYIFFHCKTCIFLFYKVFILHGFTIYDSIMCDVTPKPTRVKLYD